MLQELLGMIFAWRTNIYRIRPQACRGIFALCEPKFGDLLGLLHLSRDTARSSSTTIAFHLFLSPCVVTEKDTAFQTRKIWSRAASSLTCEETLQQQTVSFFAHVTCAIFISLQVNFPFPFSISLAELCRDTLPLCFKVDRS